MAVKDLRAWARGLSQAELNEELDERSDKGLTEDETFAALYDEWERRG